MMRSSSSNSSPQAMVAAAATIGATAGIAYIWHRHSSSDAKTAPKKLHIDYQHPDLPSFFNFMAALPKFMRRSFSLRVLNVPKPPLDAIDVGLVTDTDTDNSGSFDPYVEKVELVPNKIWRVRYQAVRDPGMVSFLKGVFGVDVLDEASQVRRAPGDNLKKLMRQTIHSMKTLLAQVVLIDKSKSDKDKTHTKTKVLLQAGFVDTQTMFVVRLEGSNNLALYNPCRMHPPIIQWIQDQCLQEEGTFVEYIVSGSSSHTNQLPQAAGAFPSAQVICARVASDKCVNVGMSPAAFQYTCQDDLSCANKVLQASGIRIFHIQGDTFTQNLLLLAHGHLLDTDLSTYGNGTRYLHTSEDDWNNNIAGSTLEMGYFRLLFYASMANGTVGGGGYLPDFRLMGCDPTSPFPRLMLEAPNPDGSSCQEMAKSVRYLLSSLEEGVVVDCAHSSLKGSLPVAEFKRAVDASWNWLDGKSLLLSE